MHPRLFPALLLVLMFLFISSARLPQSGGSGVALAAPQQSAFTVEGKITEISAGKFTVNSDQNMIFHVLYDDKTEIKDKDGKALTAQDLKKNLNVRAEGDFTEAGEIKAARITVL
jgi:Tfp pilus assembly pilus retraction ATPase PilT